MTEELEEKLEKEADIYADTVKCEWENDTYWVDCRDEVTDAYLAGAEPREKRIKELEAQTAKAKELLQRVVKWATTETCKCEKFDFILADIKQFLICEVENDATEMRQNL